MTRYYGNISEMLGKTLIGIKVGGDNDEIFFTCNDGSKFQMYHDQDCCEMVSIDEIIGNLDDLIGSEIIMAEEAVSRFNPEDVDMSKVCQDESFTWTFYKFGTDKGYVTIRWYGESNGYYSESVQLEEVD